MLTHPFSRLYQNMLRAAGVLLTLWVIGLWWPPPLAIAIVTMLVTLVSYFSAQVVPGIGIQMNALVAPLTASLGALIVGGTAAPAVAFAGGVLGVVIGADLLHLHEIERMTSGVLSIGGAGVFDGIALCGLFALLLT